MYQMRKGKRILSVLLSLSLLGSVAVPTKSSAAGTSYIVKVNKSACCVTVYKKASNGKYKPVKAMPCSPGSATPIGTFSLGSKMRWHTLQGPCYGQYCERITKGFLFHSVWYYSQNPGTLAAKEYNKLGTMASHGCVRLSVGSAKWIYDHVPAGSKVVIYSSSNPGPLGKPASIKIPLNSGWDPTDPNPSNPWKNKKPAIYGTKNITVKTGNKINLLQGVTATNTTGFGITSRIKVSVKYNKKKVSKVSSHIPGKYQVTYKVKDEIGRTAQVTRTVTVIGSKKTPTIKNVKELYVKSTKKLTKSFALKNVSIKQEGKKLATKYITVTFKKLKKNKYKVTYTAQNDSNAKVVTTKAYVDTKAPVIKGVKPEKKYVVPVDTEVTEAYVRNQITVSDNLSKVDKIDVDVSIQEKTKGKYTVTCKAVDQAGNKTTVKAYFETASDITISEAEDITINSTDLGLESKASEDDIINKLSAYLLTKTSVNAKDSAGNDVTNDMTVEIKNISNEKYEAVYSVEDKNGIMASEKISVVVKKKDFITMPKVDNQTVMEEELNVTTGSAVATGTSVVTTEMVKGYVENKGYVAVLSSGEKVPVSVSVEKKEGKYVITLFAEDGKGHAASSTFQIEVKLK